MLPEEMYRWFLISSRDNLSLVIPNNKTFSIDGWKCCLMKCCNEFRWVKHLFHASESSGNMVSHSSGNAYKANPLLIIIIISSVANYFTINKKWINLACLSDSCSNRTVTTRGKIHQLWNSTILVFNWHFYNEKLC